MGDGRLSREQAMRLAYETEGWLSNDEAGWLYDQAGFVPAGGRWVELGVWKGKSFAVVAAGLPDGCHLTGIDHWRGSGDGSEHEEAGKPGRTVLRSFLDLLVRLSELRPRLCFEVLVGDTCSFSVPADVVFVDADHRTDRVEADVQHWLPLVKPGGLLCGHDSDYPSVRQGIERVLPKYEVAVGNIWWHR